MAWDTGRPKQLLLDASTAEFSRYGLAGAGIDRIAEAILTLCDGWQALATMDRIYTGTVERDAARNATRKKSALTAVEALARELVAHG